MVEQDDGFFSEIEGYRILPYKNLFQNAITFEMSLTIMDYSRKVYNFFDFLGDIGGLFGAFVQICYFIIKFFMHNGLETFLMADLFSINSKDNYKSSNYDHTLVFFKLMPEKI